MKSRLWFALVILPIVAGAWFCVHLVLGMRDDIEAMPRVSVPGEEDLELPAGDYVLYGEPSGGNVMRLSCSIADATTGAAVKLGTSSSSTTYTMFGHHGASMFDATIEHAGTYRVSCTGDDGELAFGHGIGMSIVMVVIAGFATFGGAAIVFVLIFVLRRRAVTRAHRAA